MQIIDKWCYVRDSDNTLYVVNVPSKALRKDKYGVWNSSIDYEFNCHWIKVLESEDGLYLDPEDGGLINSKAILELINSIPIPTNEDLIEVTLRMEVLNCNYEYVDYENSSNK